MGNHGRSICSETPPRARASDGDEGDTTLERQAPVFKWPRKRTVWCPSPSHTTSGREPWLAEALSTLRVAVGSCKGSRDGYVARDSPAVVVQELMCFVGGLGAQFAHLRHRRVRVPGWFVSTLAALIHCRRHLLTYATDFTVRVVEKSGLSVIQTEISAEIVDRLQPGAISTASFDNPS